MVIDIGIFLSIKVIYCHWNTEIKKDIEEEEEEEEAPTTWGRLRGGKQESELEAHASIIVTVEAFTLNSFIYVARH